MNSFITKKKINYEMVNNMLFECEKSGIFTNSLCQYVSLLEKLIHDKLKIKNEKSVICTMSGDGALHCIVSSLNIYHKKKLKWATQAFTFPSSACNVLNDAIIIDIDHDGSMDINLIPEDVDGIIVTNVFGNVCDINKYVEWCKINKKILLFDNAATSYTFYKGTNSCNYGLGSIISFHHTKPLGFGEGGAIIVDKQYEKYVRKIMNFGIDNNKYYKKYNWNINGANYKMSEISAIFIYQYLINNFDSIIKHHKSLYEHILNKKLFLYPNFSDDTPFVSCIALLDEKYNIEYIEKKILDGYFCRKYYNPLNNSVVANEFYDKIICIPCNQDMNEILIDKYL